MTNNEKTAEAKLFGPAEVKYIRAKYDIIGTLRALAGDKPVDLGFQREISKHLENAAGRDARGFYIPTCVLHGGKQRVFTGKTNVSGHITGNGAALVKTELWEDQYIDALTADTILPKLGVEIVTGLQGDVSIPRGSAMSASWMSAEDSDAANTNPSFDNVTGTPHTVGGNTIISRKLLRQSSLSVEAMVKRLITSACSRAIEAAAYDGTGSDGQPTGLANTANVHSCDFATLGTATLADLQKFVAAVYDAIANGSAMKWVMSPAVKALLANSVEVVTVENKAKTENVGGVRGARILSEDWQKIEEYPIFLSNLCNAKKVYFGDWSQMQIGVWGEGVDVLVDPYTYSNKGALQVTCFEDVDVMVRQPAAFAIGTAIS